jgi:hypothetical protein
VIFGLRNFRQVRACEHVYQEDHVTPVNSMPPREISEGFPSTFFRVSPVKLYLVRLDEGCGLNFGIKNTCLGEEYYLVYAR